MNFQGKYSYKRSNIFGFTWLIYLTIWKKAQFFQKKVCVNFNNRYSIKTWFCCASKIKSILIGLKMDIKTCGRIRIRKCSQSSSAATVGIAIAQLKTFNTFDQTTSIYTYVVFTQSGDGGTQVTRTLQLISCLCLLRH